jgi:hypothetical protein
MQVQGWVVDFHGEGQERAARGSGDIGVAMMAAAAEDGSSGQQWRWWRTTAKVDGNSSGGLRQRTTTARKIGWRTMRGKEESGRQITMALDIRLKSPPGREHEKIKKSSLRSKTFFSDMVCLVRFFAPAETPHTTFLVYQSYAALD